MCFFQPTEQRRRIAAEGTNCCGGQRLRSISAPGSQMTTRTARARLSHSRTSVFPTASTALKAKNSRGRHLGEEEERTLSFRKQTEQIRDPSAGTLVSNKPQLSSAFQLPCRSWGEYNSPHVAGARPLKRPTKPTAERHFGA